jgi:outer membrane receptor protein involved in Fe transport
MIRYLPELNGAKTTKSEPILPFLPAEGSSQYLKTIVPKLVLCLPLLLYFFLTGQCQADTSKLDNLSLKDLLSIKITTASKTSQSAELASAVVTVVTKDQIRLRGYQSLLDVMYDLRDVKVDDKMYSGMRNSFTVRGIQGSEKFIILLDGINISSPSGEAMAIMQNYPVNLAEQIEVLYGPSSALYGANAVSGIINIITKNSKKDIIAEASTTAGDHGYTNTTLFVAKKLDKDIDIIVSGQYYYDRSPDFSKIYKNDSLSSVASYSTGTVNTIFGPFTPAAPIAPKFEAPMEAYNVYASLRAKGFSFNFFRNYFKIPTAFGNNTSNSIFNKEVFMAQSITMANANYRYQVKKLTSTTSLTASFYALDPHSNYRNLYTSMEPAYKYSTCSMFKGEQQIDYVFSDNLGITAGAGFERYTAIPQSGDLASPVNTDNNINGSYLGTAAYYRPEGLKAQFYFIQYNNIGTYLQAQYKPVEKVTITAGARYDNNSRYGGSFNPRLGIVYQPTSGTVVKLLYGSAFRAPSPTESYSQYGTFLTTDSGRNYFSYFLHLPNPGLKPITSHNTELNIKQRFSDNAFITLDAYYTTLSGLYAFSDDNATTKLYKNSYEGIPVDYIEVFTNNDRQKVYGGSLELNYKNTFNDIQLNSYAALSYTGGVKENGLKEKDETARDIQLEFISPLMLHVGTDIKINNFSFSPRLVVMSRQQISGISDTTGRVSRRQTIPGYALLNLSLRYALSKHITLHANVTNALNQRYRSVSFNMDLSRKDTELYYGQPQDPIRIMGGVNFSL